MNAIWTEELEKDFTETISHLTSLRNRLRQAAATKSKVDAYIEKVTNEKSLPPYADQIVAFRYTLDGTLKGMILKTENEVYFSASDGKWTYRDRLVRLLKNPAYEIYTVRNSNGEEFSIGDEVSFKDEKSTFRVASFYYYKDNPYDIMACEGGKFARYNIECISKKRTPLIVVEGKELFSGDEVWLVNENYGGEFLDERIFSKPIKVTVGNLDGIAAVVHHFLTRESAEAWIRDNRPSISYQQLKDYCFNHWGSDIDITEHIGFNHRIIDHFKPKQP